MKTLKQDTAKGITFTLIQKEEGYTVTFFNGQESYDTDFPNHWENNKEKAEYFYRSNLEMLQKIDK